MLLEYTDEVSWALSSFRGGFNYGLNDRGRFLFLFLVLSLINCVFLKNLYQYICKSILHGQKCYYNVLLLFNLETSQFFSCLLLVYSLESLKTSVLLCSALTPWPHHTTSEIPTEDLKAMPTLGPVYSFPPFLFLGFQSPVHFYSQKMSWGKTLSWGLGLLLFFLPFSDLVFWCPQSLRRSPMSFRRL